MCSVEKVLLEISQNLQKTPVPDSLFLIKCFPLIFAKFPRTSIFTQRLWWLLLHVISREHHSISQVSTKLW